MSFHEGKQYDVLGGVGFCLAVLIGLGIDVAFCWFVVRLWT